jgi:YfiH family protein
VFYLDQEVYRVSAFDRLEWLIHGFGTRLANIPERFRNLTTLKQVHSADCVLAGGRSGILGVGDALLENSPGSVIAVKTADCIPILVVDPHHRAVAAVHAGWRGTAAGIVQRAVKEMQEHFGSDPADLEAALGPGILECCYEVGPEVAERFGRRGRARLDLPGINRLQLIQAGVSASRIYVSNLCTMCQPEKFHSFRRDKDGAGRLYSFIGIQRLGQALK